MASERWDLMLENMARRMSSSIEPCYTLNRLSANEATAMEFLVGTGVSTGQSTLAMPISSISNESDHRRATSFPVSGCGMTVTNLPSGLWHGCPSHSQRITGMVTTAGLNAGSGAEKESFTPHPDTPFEVADGG